ncbi:tRNA (adenosine(37)-N6)-threonylcarbamoyltransferase complex ATPase subunit type 1 TsaE [Tepidimonas charontis]|uniref:tRNA threonylcarbamoyladenosine biosynthesis protein TsaE n=1 Tax=Tepidimonas charontis TaxID=2267262 RepID=A0A554X7G4_9BURK|nr:tRNA (adenosine(37)-N6)-threonylcarbamoyltransferase complex ATPase subunit type 1 TsaE [Tepidimonas charontis]TSE31757.1 tRNA threonylcarbamoyladenosine biosynthesis protein TsaE [Tepidimonas charontis]
MTEPHIAPEPLAHLEWRAHDEGDTAAVAQALAAALHADVALADALLTLRGDLGAGKTTFVRHLLRALGVTGRIKSPTYALVEPYSLTLGAQRQPWAAWHADLYRFGDPREWEDAGLRELFARPGLKLVEWPERARGMLPLPDLDIALGADADGDAEAARRLDLRAFSPLGAALLRAMPAPISRRNAT